MHTPTPRSSMVPVLVAGSIVTAVTLGVRATMGLFPDEIDASLGVGIDTVGLTVALQNLIWGLGQPIAGAIADRFGAVRVLFVGAVIYAAGLLVMATASGPASLYFGGGFVTGLGMSAASFAVVLAAMGKLVDPQRRTFALGIATAFGSFGHFVLVPLTGVLIGSLGWRTALALLALVAVSIVVVLRPLRTPPAGLPGGSGTDTAPDAATAETADHDEPLRSVLTRAARHRDYVMLNAAFFVCGFHVTFIGVHLPKSLTDAGHSARIATLSWAFIGLFNIVGAFAAGVLGSRIDKSRLLSIIYMGRAVAFVGLLVLPATPLVALGFGAVVGLVWLASVPLTSGIVLGQFGVRNAGTLFGFVFLCHQIGAFAGSYGAGVLREATGSYDLWWWLAAALGIVAAALHLAISDQPAARPLRPCARARRCGPTMWRS
ncbi:MFS transporter [Candidatus Poriferisodalis sp.]|uniref:MFS transporter n=1 Tax=Candidatus Poriferisodalis sp. TaxID=3101277 RepID=UPI003D0CDE79